jgi:hypothetical protein
MKHAILSASSSHRWLVCQGSIEANSKKVRTENFYALEGTTAHGLLEVCLRIGGEPTSYVGKKLDPKHMVIDEAMADGVGYALDYVRAYMADNPKAHVRVEHKVYYGEQIGATDEEAFGTSDIIIDNYPKEAVVIDYKHGVGISVSVKENSQLRLYATGIRHEKGRYQRYRNVVVQPRVPKRKPVQEVSFTDKELTGWLNDKVIPIVPIALGKNAPRVAGDHCQYCAADGNCIAQFDKVQELASKEFKGVTKDPKGLTPAQMSQLLNVLGTLSSIADAVKKRAIAAVHAGVKIPGYRKALTNSRRAWADDEKANALLEKLGLDKRERYRVELLSPPKAEDALKAKGKWPKKQRGVKTQITPLDEVVVYIEGNPTIEKEAEA